KAYNSAILEGDSAIGGTAYGCVSDCHQRTVAAAFRCRNAKRNAERQHREHASQKKMSRSDRHVPPHTVSAVKEASQCGSTAASAPSCRDCSTPRRGDITFGERWPIDRAQTMQPLAQPGIEAFAQRHECEAE